MPPPFLTHILIAANSEAVKAISFEFESGQTRITLKELRFSPSNWALDETTVTLNKLGNMVR
jgi:hypothetical protein